MCTPSARVFAELSTVPHMWHLVKFTKLFAMFLRPDNTYSTAKTGQLCTCMQWSQQQRDRVDYVVNAMQCAASVVRAAYALIKLCLCASGQSLWCVLLQRLVRWFDWTSCAHLLRRSSGAASRLLCISEAL